MISLSSDFFLAMQRSILGDEIVRAKRRISPASRMAQRQGPHRLGGVPQGKERSGQTGWDGNGRREEPHKRLVPREEAFDGDVQCESAPPLSLKEKTGSRPANQAKKSPGTALSRAISLTRPRRSKPLAQTAEHVAQDPQGFPATSREPTSSWATCRFL